MTINKEARNRFLAFATSNQATWAANFRDLGGAVTRMATLASNGRISLQEVEEEITTLRNKWHQPSQTTSDILLQILPKEQLDELDLFDRITLEQVIAVCRRSNSIADAGRSLFHVSRTKKRTANDSDRLRKYLSKYNLTWDELKA